MSAAVGLVQWSVNREKDIATARAMLNMIRVFRETGSTREEIARYLNSVHRMIGWVREDNRMIQSHADELSLCEIHTFDRDCNCVSPF